MHVLNELRRRSAAKIPAIIVSARDGLEDRVDGLNGGADDYIVKPFELTELEARLRAVLRRPGPASACDLPIWRPQLRPVTAISGGG